MEYTERIIEMTDWLVSHSWYRSEICNEGYVINNERFLEIFQALEEKGYYELLLVFLIKQSYELDAVRDTLIKFWTSRVFSDWKRLGTASLSQEFRERFQQELHHAKEK